ncbi:hypothetical protein LS71_005770 [Helicobacter jaachi]|uniref:Uncharacterized protein n=1 Tax=Helicobacter jaachi TaxID=1677920 RepID=A0A4U8TBJ3_9HELI|nr:hypothetical protein [Helicobacter jaachi]TLD96568.1 hypothetical protein LS71_005770 [Helicobacter jaachi]
MRKILFHPYFKSMMIHHAKDTLEFLIKESINFNVLCDRTHTHFSPELPPRISNTFGEIIPFVLAGYTFESIELQKEYMSFEAGFGSENIGSFVSIGYDGIVQILLHDSDLLREIPLFTNVSHPCFYNLSTEELEQIATAQQEGIEDSRLAFASVPENSKFFKK